MSFVLVACLVGAAITSFVGGESSTATLLVDERDVAELIRVAAMQGIRVTPQRSLADDAAEMVSNSTVFYKRGPVVAVGGDSAYVDCPCIDHVNNATWADRIANQVSNGTLKVGDTERSRNYGSAVCKAWDIGTGACSADPGQSPAWCFRRWCWVDDESCSRPDVIRSKDLPGLAYSYTTCGNTGYDWRLRDYADTLPFFAADMSPQGVWSVAAQGRLPDGVKVSTNERYMAAVAYHILKKFGLPPANVTYRPISNESLSMWDDVHSACIHDISIGNLDLCIARFWLTQEHSRMRGAWFVPISTEYIRLIMPRVDQRKRVYLRTFGDAWDLMAVAFVPFSPGLWRSVIIVLVSTSAVYYFVERPPRGQKRVGVGMGPSIYQMLKSFVSFSPNFEPHTFSGKILVLGVTFFLTVLGASFTANMATNFVRAMQVLGVQFDGVASVAGANKKLCVHVCAVPLLRKRYPGLEYETIRSFVGKDSSAYAIEDVPDLLLKGICDGAVLDEKYITERWALGDLCDYEYVGDAIFRYHIGFFASQRVVEGLSFAARSLDETGVFESIASGMNHGVVRHRCKNKVAEEGGAAQLTTYHMAGSIILVVICCIVSLLMHCLCIRRSTDYELVPDIERRIDVCTGVDIDLDGDGYVGPKTPQSLPLFTLTRYRV